MAVAKEDGATALALCMHRIRTEPATVGLTRTTSGFHGGVPCAEVIDGELCRLNRSSGRSVSASSSTDLRCMLAVQRLVPMQPCARPPRHGRCRRLGSFRQFHRCTYHLRGRHYNSPFLSHNLVSFDCFHTKFGISGGD